MNQQNAKEFLPLIQAMAEGKTIQYQIGHELWHDIEWVDTIEGYSSDYRIKPEPRTFKLWLDKDTGCLSTDELIREFGHVRFDSLERITVMEVVK